MVTIDFAYKLVGVCAIVVAVIAWLIRLEAKVMYLEKDHEAHKNINEKKDKSLWDKIDSLQVVIMSMKETLARIEERLKPKE